MYVRERFDRKLAELREKILAMGILVEEELTLALAALEGLDTELADQVFVVDAQVNQARFAIEDECFSLIVTQQPAARDLRTIVSAMNMCVDLERMGDQAKGIAKIIPHLRKQQSPIQMPELKEMGDMVTSMLHQAMLAYAHSNTDLAQAVADRDDEVDRLYGRAFAQVMTLMAEAGRPDRAEAVYEILRAARELERFGDLATNVAERVVYMVTGSMQEMNVDKDDAAE